MTLNEYLDYIERMQKQSSKITDYGLLTQKLMSPTMLSAMNLQNRVLKTYAPSINTLKQYENMFSKLNPAIQKIINTQQSMLSKFDLISHIDLTSCLSEKSSQDFSHISLELLNELDVNDLPEDIIESKETAVEISTQKTPLTLGQVLCIIEFIIVVISFCQAQLPNQQLQRVENGIYQLVEIQSKVLESLISQSTE